MNRVAALPASCEPNSLSRPLAPHRHPGPKPPAAHPIAALLDIAFQPIVDIHTGRVLGYEALMRGVERAGFACPVALLDARAAAGDLPDLEAAILAMAFARFAEIEDYRGLKLFVNLDGRTIAAGEPIRATLAALKRQYGLSNANLAIEVSERFDFNAHDAGFAALMALRAEFGSLALDDFGAGHANLQAFYHVEPSILKLDRFITSSIGSDPKKVVFLRHIVNMAHLLGSLVVAEGVETPQEYRICRELGCDLVQGFAVAYPTTNLTALKKSHGQVVPLFDRDRRRRETDVDLVMSQLEPIAPLHIAEELDAVFDCFGRDPNRTFFPVIDEIGSPVGLVHERDLKGILYSKYGRDLLQNRHRRHQWPLKAFVRPCPVANASASAEKILGAFASLEDSEGVIIVADSRYRGFLHARALLRIINEKNLQVARDQNPLTKLPGNIVIQDYLAQAGAADAIHHFAYLDFDHFKPFNDTYGFRTGDRAILMFADILRRVCGRTGRFIGHVGGDDFFVGFTGIDEASAVAELEAVVAKFKNDVESLYAPEDRRRGYIRAAARSGRSVRFPLLAISGAIIHKPAGRPLPPLDRLSTLIAAAKTSAKQGPEKIVRVVL
jgi:diguanylate cyclase (GGDEF)-like protein